MSVSTSEEHAAEVIAAADLMRAEGYAVVYAVEHEMWTEWLRQAHERTRKLHDVEQQLIWEVLFLQGRVKELLGESRPRWWRRHLAWWNRYGYHDPIVFGKPPEGPS